MDIGHAQCDDFPLQPHFHAVKGHLRGIGFFMFQRGQTRILAQESQHRVNSFGAAGNRAVNALSRQQQRALHAVGFTTGLQRRLQGRKVRQFNKFVKCSSQKVKHGVRRVKEKLHKAGRRQPETVNYPALRHFCR